MEGYDPAMSFGDDVAREYLVRGNEAALALELALGTGRIALGDAARG